MMASAESPDGFHPTHRWGYVTLDWQAGVNNWLHHQTDPKKASRRRRRLKPFYCCALEVAAFIWQGSRHPPSLSLSISLSPSLSLHTHKRTIHTHNTHHQHTSGVGRCHYYMGMARRWPLSVLKLAQYVPFFTPGLHFT